METDFRDRLGSRNNASVALTSVQYRHPVFLDKVTSEETTENYAEDTSYSRLKGNNLNFGTVKVQKISSNEIGIYGLTQCHHDVILYIYIFIWKEK